MEQHGCLGLFDDGNNIIVYWKHIGVGGFGLGMETLPSGIPSDTSGLARLSSLPPGRTQKGRICFMEARHGANCTAWTMIASWVMGATPVLAPSKITQ